MNEWPLNILWTIMNIKWSKNAVIMKFLRIGQWAYILLIGILFQNTIYS